MCAAERASRVDSFFCECDLIAAVEARTLDAAVAAVEREPWRERRSNNDGMGGFVGGVSVSQPETFTYLVSRDSLLAAINALRPAGGAA
jgi:hypothetical protein